MAQYKIAQYTSDSRTQTREQNQLKGFLSGESSIDEHDKIAQFMWHLVQDNRGCGQYTEHRIH